MIPGTPSPPISTTPIGGAAVPADLSAATAAHLSAAAAHHQHHHQQQQQHNHHHRLQQHHHHQQQQHAMAMAIAAGMTRTSPPTSATTLNGLLAAGGNGAGVSGGYDEGGGRSTSSPSSSTTTTTLGDICGALGSAMVMGPGGPHGCAQCTAAFPTRELLEKHEMMHSPNTTVSCKVCHKTFANVYRLQRHMISHDESALLRKFKCTECDKAFKFKHHLKEHVRIHSGEKPFACDNCGKRFSHSGSYSSHMTSKKCISMGLKLNNNRSIMKSLEKAGGPLGLGSPNSKRGLVPNSMGYFPPGLPNVALTGALNNNNTATSPNNNAFYPILPKYSNYDAMNAALLASFQNPFYGMAAALDPRIHPYSIHRLLELTAAGSSHNKDLLNCNYIENGNKTPSLHSDPEDMIEEVTEDVPKLVMDLGDDEKSEQKFHKSQPNSPMNSNYESYLEHDSGPPSNQHEDPTPGEGGDMMKEEEQHDSISNEQQDSPDIKVEDNTDEESKESTLQCGRCDKKFNHQTELVQHEKVLCGLLDHQQRREASHEAEPQNSSYFHSGSDEDAEDRESKTGSECERKVRVRTAITEEQQSILKEHYALNARPSREEFRIIAGRLGLDARVVQVWFQNNRSRERKLNSFNLVNKNFTSPILGQSSASPAFSPTSSSTGNAGGGGAGASGPAGSGEDQPLDLSIKKEMLRAIRSPQYGTAPQQSDISEAINLSRKSSLSPSPYRAPYYAGSAPYRSAMMRHTPSPNEAVPRQPQTNPYMLPSARGLVPMECLLQMTPEYARSQLLGLKLGERGTSLSPGSEKRSWRDDDSRISHDDEFGMMHATGKRLKLEANGNPDIDCPFVCDQCDKAFSKQSSLARHKYEHSGQRPYKCEECPKAFKHKHHLTEHKRLHSGEKPFQCTKCLKRFSHSGSYSQHMNHRYSYCKPYRE